ncbi:MULTISPECIES: POTRA domain-containing protein [unclassified Carboxylicivirga]|uniref:POTRA domain-containing protein n=1 Tax=Carboxylicivirga TaxID=1628153 RepID=UPI003D32A4CD
MVTACWYALKIVCLWLVLQGIGGFMCIRAQEEAADVGIVDEYVRVQQVVIAGNKVTRSRVILNELVFNKGDVLMVNRLGQVTTRCRHNLLNTGLFNFVSVRYTLQADNTVIFYVRVDERWYWWVFPIFEVADRNLSSFFNGGDWSRVNYGVYLKRDNFRGRNEKIMARIRLGFTKQVLLGYFSPEYKRRGGWGVFFDFRMHDQLPYTTKNNQQVYKALETEMAQVTYFGSVYYSIRSGLYHRHKLELGYHNYSVSDSIIDLNPNYLTPDATRLQFMELSYEYDYDTRDAKVYPLKGTRMQGTAVQSGLGIWQEGLNNFKLSARIDKHWQLENRWHWASLLYGEYNSSRSLPYVLNAGSGYDSFLNGYELYVMDGTRQASMKNYLLFTLLQPRVKNLGFMPLTQFAKVNYAFYIKAFGDFGYVWHDNPSISNTFVNNWQYGYGVGLDFVTFYDMVWSFNYSMNKHRQHGFFVHLNIAI